MRAEGQPVDQGGHHRGVLKKLGPSGKWEIRRHNGAAFFAPVRYHFEQQLRLVPVETEITSRVQKKESEFNFPEFDDDDFMVASKKPEPIIPIKRPYYTNHKTN